MGNKELIKSLQEDIAKERVKSRELQEKYDHMEKRLESQLADLTKQLKQSMEETKLIKDPR